MLEVSNAPALSYERNGKSYERNGKSYERTGKSYERNGKSCMRVKTKLRPSWEGRRASENNSSLSLEKLLQ